MVGAKSPWGQNDRTLGGEGADEHLQPGSGATSRFAGLAYSIAAGPASHWYASAMGRWNGENAHGYRYGDVLIGNLAYRRAISGRVSASGELNFRAARRDPNAGILDQNTGGAVLYATPQ